MLLSHQLLKYFCSKCGTLLKEIKEAGSVNVKLCNLEEECPKCGSRLVRTLKREWKLNEELQSQLLSSDLSTLLPKFQTAYEQISDRLTFDIEKIDSILSLTAGEELCIIGEKHYTHTLIARLCVRALMSKRQGGFDCQNIIFVDSGNSVDIYQYVNFARQYGLDIKKVLQSIIVSRSFNLYQLANTVIYKLPKVIKQYNPKIIVISDLLDIFLRDPQILIKEAEHIIKEIINSIKIRKTSGKNNNNNNIDDVLYLVSSSNDHSAVYNKVLPPSFDKHIEITRSKTKPSLLNVKVKNYNYNKKCSSSSTLQIQQKDLQIISPR
jgi:DNA-directed RNA polymerase subunit RPC12/RpoP